MGPGGLLGELTKRVLESALEGEMDDHLGYAKHDPAGHNSGNSRNGRRSKTVTTEAGPVEIDVPRDRESTFEPQLVRKRQRWVEGVDELVISLSAKDLTHGEIAAHLQEVYRAEGSKQTTTTITDQVVEEMVEWQSRPLDPVYPVIFGTTEDDGCGARSPVWLSELPGLKLKVENDRLSRYDCAAIDLHTNLAAALPGSQVSMTYYERRRGIGNQTMSIITANIHTTLAMLPPHPSK